MQPESGQSHRNRYGPQFYAYLGLILWLPVPWGSNVVWAWSLMEAWILILSLVWLIQYFRSTVFLTRSFIRAWPVTVCLLLTLLWVEFQTLALPVNLLGALSPQALDIHSSTQSYPSLSLDVHATRSGALKTLSYLLLFCLTLLLVNSGQRVRMLARTIVFSGFLQAGYGALIALIYGGSATGTFVNRNHFAGYLSICLAVGIGLMLAELSTRAASDWRERTRRLLTTLLGSKAYIRLALVVMVIALVLTHSRMGNVAFFLSLTLMGGFYLFVVRRITRGTVIFFISLLVIDVVIVGNFFGIEQVAERLQQTSTTTTLRDDLAQDTWMIVRDFPLAGTGAGSFYSVYPSYNSGAVGTLFFQHAENDYLQFASEFGLGAFALLGFSLLVSLSVAIRAQLRRRNDLMKGMGFTAAMAILALLIHSTADFNLQIPANAATIMVILALAWVARHCNHKRPGS